MRVKLSGPVEVVEALEATVQSTPGASLKSPLRRQESAELRFGLKEFADIVVVLKDFAELVALCWGGLQVLRGAAGKPDAKSRETASPAEADHAPATQKSIPIEITTPAARILVAVPLESTPEQLEELLISLHIRRAP